MTKFSESKATDTPNWLVKHWKTIILIISVALALFLFESSIYYFFIYEKFTKYWIVVPCFTYVHLVFSGNPGTGKTTIARLLAKIYKSIGVLSQGQFIETDRSGLVGGYVGQTAIKTKEVIDSAMGGILFIDEAYALTHGKGENDFGQEAVDTILKAMEDHRDDFIVIVAGYTELMKEFVGSNPGLKSRFNQYISFEDYKPEELKQIFYLLCKNKYTLSEDCDIFLQAYFEKMYNNRSADYANGRDVRNFFEKVYRAQANQILLTVKKFFKLFDKIRIDNFF